MLLLMEHPPFDLHAIGASSRRNMEADESLASETRGGDLRAGRT